MTRNPLLVAVLLLCLPVAACNAITGADGLVIDDGEQPKEGDEAAAAGPTGDPAGGGGSTAAAGGDPTGAGAGDTTGSGTDDGMGDAVGVYIEQVAIYQGVKRVLMEGGSVTPGSTPVIEGRDALLRVFTGIDNGYNLQPVTARLYLNDSPTPIEITQNIQLSTDGALGSTLNFDIPGEEVRPGFSYRIEIKQPTPGTVHAPAMYPAAGFESVGSEATGVLRVVVVPIQYNADGSGRLPDTSTSQMDRYRDLFFAMYPVPEVEITVREAVGWDGAIDPGGGGWESLLTAFADFREQDGAPSDTYYYGIFAPDSSLSAFCGGGCVAGLGYVGGANDSWTRAAIGLGFGGATAAETAVHEVGHNHGRNHAPCGGAGGVDGGYPHDGGEIGVWGYDLVYRDLKAPGSHADVMGYCNPIWVSDYTFNALANRSQAVNGSSLIIPPDMLDRTWERVRIGADGSVSWLAPLTMRTPPIGGTTPVRVERADGTVEDEATAHFYGYDHIGGGVLFVPPGAEVSTLELEVSGNLVKLSK